MKTRISIAEIMAIIVILALDCVALRALTDQHLGALIALIAAGCPMMGSILAIRFMRLLRQRRTGAAMSHFLGGFLVAGAAGLCAYVIASVLFAQALIDTIDMITNKLLDPLLRSLDATLGSVASAVAFMALLIAGITLIQMIPAVIGGMVHQRYKIRLVVERRQRSVPDAETQVVAVPAVGL